MKQTAHLLPQVIFWIISCCACSNYGLREQLENPGAGATLSALTIFVTASTHAANLNVAGPDNICRQEFAKPERFGQWSLEGAFGL